MSHRKPSTENRPTSSSSLLGKFGSLKKKKHAVVETKTFIVHYLGQQGVAKVDGLDTVRPVVQVGGAWVREGLAGPCGRWSVVSFPDNPQRSSGDQSPIPWHCALQHMH